MSDVNWWLMLLSFLLGALITWFWSVRRATREVPRTVVDRDRDFTGSLGGKAAGVGAGVAGAGVAGAAALRNKDADLDVDSTTRRGDLDTGFGADSDVDLTTRRGDLDVDRPATEVYDRTSDESVSTSWDAPEVNTPDVDAPSVDGPSFERPDLDAPDLDAPSVDGPSFERPDLDAPDLDAPSVDGPSFERPDLDAPDLDAPDVKSPGVAGGAVGATAAGAAGLGAASWASRSGDADADVSADTSSDAEIIESEADLETPAAPSGEANWSSDSSSTTSDVDWNAPSTDSSLPESDASIDDPSLDAPGASGSTTSVMSSRDAGDLAAAKEPVVETDSGDWTGAETSTDSSSDTLFGDDSQSGSGGLSAAGAAGAAGATGLAGAGAAAAAGKKDTSGGVSGATKAAAISEGKFGKGSADAGADGSGPDGWTIKADEDSNLFHTEESPAYGRSKGEIWFDSEESARGAGFVRWDEKDRSGGGAGGAAKQAEFPEGRFGKGSATPGKDGSGPQGWAIKGNENSMLFHTEDSPAYGRTKAEVWFQDEEAARKAGFTKWNERNR